MGNDLLNNTYGNLFVIGLEKKYPRGNRWTCKCSCGEILSVRESDLLNGNKKSCGCLKKTTAIKNIQKYNKSKNVKTNRYIQFDDETIIGFTEDGTPFLFDAEFYTYIKKYHWFINGDGYPCASNKLYINETDSYTQVKLHQLILDTRHNHYVADHINHDILDNRLSNLRLSNLSQNSANQRSHKGKSGYRGVVSSGNKYMAIARNPDSHTKQYLGTFDTPIEAALSFDSYIFQIRGWFSTLNFPERFYKEIQIERNKYSNWFKENINDLTNNEELKVIWHSISNRLC